MRTTLFGAKAFSISSVASHTNLADSGLLRPPSVRGLPYELRPNHASLHQGVWIETNSEGFRMGPTAEDDPLPPEIRIVFLGDSYTMGTGVATEATYPHVATAKLRALIGTSVEARNLAVPGYNLEQYLVLLDRALAYKPDVLVIGFCA